MGNTLTATDYLAVTKGRNTIEETARTFGHSGFHKCLVAVVVQTHRENGTAL